MFITTATIITTHRNRDGYETITVSEYGLLPAQKKSVYDDYKQKIIINKWKIYQVQAIFSANLSEGWFSTKGRSGLYREKKSKDLKCNIWLSFRLTLQWKKMKLVKPQVLEAVALPQIYADLIQHKGLFKYYITYFWTILDVHPPPVTFFSINKK